MLRFNHDLLGRITACGSWQFGVAGGSRGRYVDEGERGGERDGGGL